MNSIRLTFLKLVSFMRKFTALGMKFFGEKFHNSGHDVSDTGNRCLIVKAKMSSFYLTAVPDKS